MRICPSDDTVFFAGLVGIAPGSLEKVPRRTFKIFRGETLIGGFVGLEKPPVLEVHTGLLPGVKPTPREVIESLRSLAEQNPDRTLETYSPAGTESLRPVLVAAGFSRTGKNHPEYGVHYTFTLCH